MRSAAEPPRRLFIGLFPDPAVQTAIIQHRNAWDWPRGSRLTRAHRLHLTLHFLGYVDVARQLELQTTLASAAMKPLDLVLNMPQAWRGGVAVLMPDEHAGLLALHDQLVPLLQRVGLNAASSRWKPHLTIAREAADTAPPERPVHIPWRVNEFVLVWSQMSPTVRYEILARYPATESPR